MFWLSAKRFNPPKHKTSTSTRASNLTKSLHAWNIKNALPPKNRQTNKTLQLITLSKKISKFWLQRYNKWSFLKIKSESEKETCTLLFLDKGEKERCKRLSSMIKIKPIKSTYKERTSRPKFYMEVIKQHKWKYKKCAAQVN